MLRRSLPALIIGALLALWAAPDVTPVDKDSLRFVVIGDTGTGDSAATEIANQVARVRTTFPFEFALMLGDNIYGSEKPKDFERKFERPFKPLIDAGVRFYAALGNHDDRNQRFYKLFNMNGWRYYTFRPRAGVRFFALDSNYMDRDQLDWLERELKASGSEWKICFFHHPIYSSGKRHGPSVQLAALIEPLFVKYSVDVVLSGHEHIYERIKPQRGIYYFIVGSSAKLRAGGILKTGITAKGFATDRAFMVMELSKDQIYFHTVARSGQVVDSGVLERRK